MGQLRALVHVPDEPVAALVLVDGSGEGWVAGAPRLAGLAVFPGADHGLFVADPEPGVDRTSQLAAGFLPMLGSFLRSVG